MPASQYEDVAKYVPEGSRLMGEELRVALERWKSRRVTLEKRTNTSRPRAAAAPGALPGEAAPPTKAKIPASAASLAAHGEDPSIHLEQAARELGSAGANAAAPGRGGQAILDWAERNNKVIPSERFDQLQPPVSNSTSEHEVFFDQNSGQAIKRTWSGNRLST
jgi:hypothetical protein